jgi:antitoxin component YwqK of YwqJK toxin-antitoxin module
MGGDRLEVGGHGCDAVCKLADGHKHGPSVKWYNHGSKSGKMYYQHGSPKGPARIWHENGQLNTEVWWDVPGCFKRWDTQGNMVEEDCD